jgi:hypothetical protein
MDIGLAELPAKGALAALVLVGRRLRLASLIRSEIKLRLKLSIVTRASNALRKHRSIFAAMTTSPGRCAASSLAPSGRLPSGVDPETPAST